LATFKQVDLEFIKEGYIRHWSRLALSLQEFQWGQFWNSIWRG